MGSGLDFATFMNSAMKNNNGGMWGDNGLLWIFLLLLVGGSTQATSPFTVALYQNEVALPETTTTVYSTAANNRVNLQVVATSVNSGT